VDVARIAGATFSEKNVKEENSNKDEKIEENKN
jgi:hypothetical protein